MTSQQQLFYTRSWNRKDIVIWNRFCTYDIIDQFVQPREQESQTQTETRRAEMRQLVKNAADGHRRHRKRDAELLNMVCYLFIVVFSLPFFVPRLINVLLVTEFDFTE